MKREIFFTWLFYLSMDHKTLLEKVNREIPENKRKQAREIILQEKKKGTAASDCWEKITDGLHQKRTNKKRVDLKKNKPERVKGEVITDTTFNMPEIERKIEDIINDFCTRYEVDGIQGLKKSKQTTWNSLCIYIGERIFKGTNILKDNTLKKAGCTLSTCNKYDIDKMCDVLNYCYYLCGIYDKAFTWWSAAAFCGVDSEFLSDHAEELTHAGFRVMQKTEAGLNDAMLGSSNVMGYIATLNHRFGWSNPQQTTQPQQINVAVYPVLNANTPPAIPDSNNM